MHNVHNVSSSRVNSGKRDIPIICAAWVGVVTWYGAWYPLLGVKKAGKSLDGP